MALVLRCSPLNRALAFNNSPFRYLRKKMNSKDYFEKMDAILGAAQEFVESDSFKESLKSMLLTKSKIEAFMPRDSNDPRFVVISGHLLIEKIFDDFVRSNLKRPEMIEGKEINYRQLIAFSRAMQPKDIIQPWMYKAMNILAILRDLYAHNLDPKEGMKNIEKFVELVKSNKEIGQVKIDGKFSELASAIIFLALKISGLLQAGPFLTAETAYNSSKPTPNGAA